MATVLRAKRIRIAVDLTPLLPGGMNGGVKPAILEFIRALQSFQDPVFAFFFITAGSTHVEVQSIMTARDRAFCLDSPEAPKSKPIHFFRGEKIDLLYAPFGMVRFRDCGVPIISMVVDLLHRDYPHSIPEVERDWREAYFPQMVQCADRFQVVSDYTAERLVHHYGVPAEKIFRTYLPIQDRLKITKSAKKCTNSFFFYPANFWVHKNHEVLLIAYQLYRSFSGAEAWDLVLTGADDSRRWVLQELAEGLGIADHVRFTGYVSEMELGRLYSEAAALVFPSLYEGFGIPTVEAMRLGVPILASGGGSLREVVGAAGLVADSRKPLELAVAMQKLASSAGLRAELRRLGLERSRNFTLETEVTRLAEVFVQTARKTRKVEWAERLRRGFSLLGRQSAFWYSAAANRVFRLLLHRV
jgi:glycosyltransferase involved in cell wall biosynthesis